LFIRIPYFDIGFEWGRKSREPQDTNGPDPETNVSGFQFLGVMFVRFRCIFRHDLKVVGVAVFSRRLYFKAGITSS